MNPLSHRERVRVRGFSTRFEVKLKIAQNPFKIVKQLVVLVSDNHKALTLNQNISLYISFGLPVMMRAIKLNHQFSLKTHKIGNVTADWKLSPKFAALKMTAAQNIPQKFFRMSLIFS